MADYESKYTTKDKQAALRDAIRRMEPVHQHWRMLESLYRIGAQREVTAIDLNRILPFPTPGTFLRTVNMVLPHLNLIINSVTARDPKLIVTPIGGDETVIEQNATIAKAVLDYFWRRTASTDVLRDMTQDMVVIGNGFCKVGWSYSESTSDRTDDDIASAHPGRVRFQEGRGDWPGWKSGSNQNRENPIQTLVRREGGIPRTAAEMARSPKPSPGNGRSRNPCRWPVLRRTQHRHRADNPYRRCGKGAAAQGKRCGNQDRSRTAGIA